MIKKLFATSLICCTLFALVNAQNDAIIVSIKTKYGTIKLNLYNETPLHRDNFIKLISKGYYDGLLFHRVISDFMIQGGDPDSKEAPEGKTLGLGGPGYTIPAEFNRNFIHAKGALAAARLGDQANPLKESSGSQFYIVQGTAQSAESLSQMENQRINIRKNILITQFLSQPNNKHIYDTLIYAKNVGNRDKYLSTMAEIDIIMKSDFENLDTLKYTPEQKQLYIKNGGTPHLDFDYTVFGNVIEGFEVINLIASQPCTADGRPVEDIKMEIKIVKK